MLTFAYGLARDACFSMARTETVWRMKPVDSGRPNAQLGKLVQSSAAHGTQANNNNIGSLSHFRCIPIGNKI